MPLNNWSTKFLPLPHPNQANNTEWADYYFLQFQAEKAARENTESFAQEELEDVEVASIREKDFNWAFIGILFLIVIVQNDRPVFKEGSVQMTVKTHATTLSVQMKDRSRALVEWRKDGNFYMKTFDSSNYRLIGNKDQLTIALQLETTRGLKNVDLIGEKGSSWDGLPAFKEATQAAGIKGFNISGTIRE